MKTILTCLLSLTIIATISIAQESENKEFKHLVVLATGYTFIPKATSIGGTEPNGVFVPSIGMDYFYKLSPKFEIGTMIDLELGDYLIFEKDLSREKAFLVLAVGSYRLFPNVNVFTGAGIELEKHEHLGVFRLGAEYTFRLNNDWVIGPGFFYDIKKGYDTWCLSIGLGKEF